MQLEVIIVVNQGRERLMDCFGEKVISEEEYEETKRTRRFLGIAILAVVIFWIVLAITLVFLIT